MRVRSLRMFLLAVLLVFTGCTETRTDQKTATPTPIRETSLPGATPAPPTPTGAPTQAPLPALQPITVENAGQVQELAVLEIPGYGGGPVSQCNVTFSPLGDLLAATCQINRVPVWDLASLELVSMLYQPAEDIVSCAFSPDGRTVACGKYDAPRTIDLFDPYTGEMTGQLSEQQRAIWELAFDPSGDFLVSVNGINNFGRNSQVIYWSLADGEQVWAHQPGNNNALGVAVHPSGEVVAISSLDGLVEVLPAETGEALYVLTDSSSNMGDLAFSPDGQFLAAGSDDALIYLWETGSYTLAATLPGHRGYVNGIDYSADGTLLVSGSADASVAIWDAVSLERLAVLEGHRGSVLRVEINPADTLIASVSWDGTVRLWGIPAGE